MPWERLLPHLGLHGFDKVGGEADAADVEGESKVLIVVQPFYVALPQRSGVGD